VKWFSRPDLPSKTRHPDVAAFERAVLPHLDGAHNLARWLVRDATLAEDVVQDAVVRALNYFASFRGDDARAWLMRIVRNTAYGALTARRQRRETSRDGFAGIESDGFGDAPLALDHPDPADDPEAALTRRQRLDCMENALAALPIELRECLVLRELEELSYKEIAQVTEVPVGTVMSRLWRARQTLADMGRLKEVRHAR
jgi:RNA polymerase sigma-70 factor (ECF subfamily)